MTTEFPILFSVAISHAFHGNGGQDFDFFFPLDTKRTLADGRMVAKVMEGVLYVFYESDGTGAPRVPLAGSKLRIGLILLNPYFGNFTELDFDLGRTFPLYRNTADVRKLDRTATSVMVGTSLRHTPTGAARPVTLTLRDAAGNILKMDTLTATAGGDSIVYDLTGSGPGAYLVEEEYWSESAEVSYYSDPELPRAGAFGIVEIVIDDAFVGAPAALQIVFQSRSEILRWPRITTMRTSPGSSSTTQDSRRTCGLNCFSRG